MIIEAVKKCWRSDVFLRPLTGKFWKLTLQIIARYSKAVEMHCAEDFLLNLKKKKSENVPKFLHPSPSDPNFNAKGHFRTSSDTKIAGKLKFFYANLFLLSLITT